MKLTITQLNLKTPFHFFGLSQYALAIINQMKKTNCVAFKKTGLWKKHYTMSLWESEQDLREFALSGAHLDAMKKGQKIVNEIKTLTIEADKFPDWKTAKSLLENAKVVMYR